MSHELSPQQQVEQAFEKAFGVPPAFVTRAPGRVNLIGEHTDYNDGFVFPVAIDREVLAAGRLNGLQEVRAWSVNFKQRTSFSLSKLERSNTYTWINYVQGVVKHLGESGVTAPGFDVAIVGNVPPGSGLSSSAAIEVAT